MPFSPLLCSCPRNALTSNDRPARGCHLGLSGTHQDIRHSTLHGVLSLFKQFHCSVFDPEVSCNLWGLLTWSWPPAFRADSWHSGSRTGGVRRITLPTVTAA
ncbi:hypothetical protein ElyMa_000259700 [Elysia marginata]|uniref:Uncharacterized protein n=1 Tax=Elysia marginata TaxID=1093978 RepID=A0AAV4F3J5_9GAST|nr:hypothetical protein ElyMa_000259700 [Elysia marginata]